MSHKRPEELATSHDHDFARPDRESERRTLLVAGLTAGTMVVEIVAGLVYGSMALLADGWHMGTHVGALGISVFAYRYARKHRHDPRFTFGTGKVGVLGGFASAVALAVVALLMGAESIERFFVQTAIRFDQAMLVAALGLAVNVISALVLGGAHRQEHDGDASAGHVHDHNLRAAYMHVVADALTSVLAIIALVVAKMTGHVWIDPAVALVGCVLIARWAYRLIADSAGILIDGGVERELLQAVRSAIEFGGDGTICDLHVWRIGPNDHAAIVSVVTERELAPDHYKRLLRAIPQLSHVSVEVNRSRAGRAGEDQTAALL